jgi:putative ABC transport system substrate-binding protein
VIVAVSTPAVRAVKDLTRTIPIVFVAVDPVATGLVPSLARPAGNVTGLSITMGDEFASKWLQLLGEAIPRLSRVAILWNPTNPSNRLLLKAVEVSAQKLRINQLHDVKDSNQLDGAFGAVASSRAQTLIVIPDPLTVHSRARIMDLASKHRLPVISGFREFADAGGLMAYGSSVAALCRRAAIYVDKILKGDKPGDLPVEQATNFEFVINLKTAKALGLTIPPSLLARADQVLE